MIFVSNRLFFGFCCVLSAMQLSGMFLTRDDTPLCGISCDTTPQAMLFESLGHREGHVGFSGTGACADSGIETPLAGFVSFDCTYDKFQCLNGTHSTYQDCCIPRSIVFLKHGASHDDGTCVSINPLHLYSAVLPLAVTCAVTLDRIGRKIPIRIKNVAKLGMCSALYTASCLYAFENHTEGSDTAAYLTAFLMGCGNIFLADYLGR
jgi:hypothetical protein